MQHPRFSLNAGLTQIHFVSVPMFVCHRVVVERPSLQFSLQPSGARLDNLFGSIAIDHAYFRAEGGLISGHVEVANKIGVQGQCPTFFTLYIPC